jgi:hypothetical protein
MDPSRGNQHRGIASDTLDRFINEDCVSRVASSVRAGDCPSDGWQGAGVSGSVVVPKPKVERAGWSCLSISHWPDLGG